MRAFAAAWLLISLGLAGAVLFGAVPGRAAAIQANEASAHAGERGTVCGRVASVYYARRSRAKPTFLDFGRDYPRATFTAVIFGKALGAFGDLRSLRGREVCVTGTIQLYRGRPEMILERATQLRAR